MRSTSASWTADKSSATSVAILASRSSSPTRQTPRGTSSCADTSTISYSDPELALERKIAEKYTGAHVDVEPPGTARFAATVIVEKINPHQLGH